MITDFGIFTIDPKNIYYLKLFINEHNKPGLLIRLKDGRVEEWIFNSQSDKKDVERIYKKISDAVVNLATK